MGVQEFKQANTKIMAEARRFLHNKSEFNSRMSSEPSNLPDNFNWAQKGVLSPTKDAMDHTLPRTIIGVLEAYNLIQNGKQESLSTQQLIDCVSDSFGSDIKLQFEYIKSHGLMDTSDYPTTGRSTGDCQDSKGTAKFFFKDYEIVPKANSDALKHAIYTNPTVVAINASK